MTICIVTNMTFGATGGIPNYNKFLAENLIANKHNVIVLSVNRNKDGTDNIEQTGNLTRIELGDSFQKYKNRYSRFFREGGYEVYDWIATGMSTRDWLLNYHARYKIDLIEAGDYGGLGFFLNDKRLPPLFINAHSSLMQLQHFNYIPDDDHTRILMKLEELSFTHADAILAHSFFNKENLEKLLCREILFSRAPWVFPKMTESQINLDSKVKKNVVVSSLQIAKGPELMIKSIENISTQDSYFKLDWIGGDTFTGPAGEKVSSFLAKKYPSVWDSQFKWRGEKDHDAALKILAQASCVFIPSLWDTFNYTAIEAAYFKRPLVITNKTGAAYLFQNDPNIKIIPPEHESFSEILANKQMMTDWELSINSNTKEMLNNYFSSEKIVDERTNQYKRVLEGRNTEKPITNEALGFLKNFLTPPRRFYFTLRRSARKIIKRK